MCNESRAMLKSQGHRQFIQNTFCNRKQGFHDFRILYRPRISHLSCSIYIIPYSIFHIHCILHIAYSISISHFIFHINRIFRNPYCLHIAYSIYSAYFTLHIARTLLRCLLRTSHVSYHDIWVISPIMTHESCLHIVADDYSSQERELKS